MNESQGKVQCAVQAQVHNILLLPKKCTPAHMHTIQAQKHAAMCTAHRKITHTEATTWRKTAGLQSKNKIQIHRYTGPAFHRCLIFFHMRMRKRQLRLYWLGKNHDQGCTLLRELNKALKGSNFMGTKCAVFATYLCGREALYWQLIRWVACCNLCKSGRRSPGR